MNTNFAISVDWLQVYCLSKEIDTISAHEYLSANSGRKYVVSDCDVQTAMFKHLFEVTSNNRTVATIECSPRSSRLKKNMVLIKLDNRVLYCEQYVAILYDLMTTLDVEYKGITRIDLCYDCVAFNEFRSPSKFINNYVLRSDLQYNGISRKGSDEFTAHGKKARGSSSKINYLSFGSPQSRVRCYMYDKTLELQEVHDKPWIREVWENNGITSDEKNHVFRTEISIKSEGTDLLNMSTGELFRLSPIYCENQINIEKLFHYYADHYLCFRQCKGQKLKKNYKQIDLFCNKPQITCKPYHLNQFADTGRSEKICYNKLQKLATTYTNLSEYRVSALRSSMEFLKDLQGLKETHMFHDKQIQYLENIAGHKFYDEHLFQFIYDAERVKEAKERIYAEYESMCSAAEHTPI